VSGTLGRSSLRGQYFRSVATDEVRHGPSGGLGVVERLMGGTLSQRPAYDFGATRDVAKSRPSKHETLTPFC